MDGRRPRRHTRPGASRRGFHGSVTPSQGAVNLLAHPRLAAWPRNSREAPSLAQCLTLAALLHLLAVLMVGTAPGALSTRGEGLWGSLSVTLRGLRSEPDAGTPLTEPRNRPGGRAPQPSSGGAVREREAPSAAEPGAAR